MAKKVSFGAKPMEKSAAAEQWVESRAPLGAESMGGSGEENGVESDDEEVVMKRLTIDLPASLHKRVKSGCAQRGVKMVDEIRRLLEEHFPG